MVWGLFPADSFPGGQKYYFFSKGTYKAGRKGCDIAIQNDRGVSRIHADMIIDAMTSRDPPQNTSDNFLSTVRIKDLSKYGTFINKGKESLAVNEVPNKEKILKNGDQISFGTGNAVFRFSYVPLTFFIHSLKPSETNPSFLDIISSIGASSTSNWNRECTHVIADESTSVTEGLICAIVAEKPIIRSDWVKAVADKKILTELPSYTSYIPNLRLERETVKIAEPEVRRRCLAGRTFVLGLPHLYIFGDHLRSLLEACSADIVLVDEFCLSSQTAAEANNSLVLVCSEGSLNQFHHVRQLISLQRVNDIKLVAAVLSGHFDPSIVESPSIVISSQSSDETIVADSDAETDTAVSDSVVAVGNSEAAVKPEEKKETSDSAISAAPSTEAVKYNEKKEASGNQAEDDLDKKYPGFKVDSGGMIERRNKADESERYLHENSDIIYSQDLLVRDINIPAEVPSMSNTRAINFKQFRKKVTPSGNSFKDLIPFSKDPYKESNLGNEDIAKYVREEKKRKQLEAVAEDLFNSRKVALEQCWTLSWLMIWAVIPMHLVLVA